MFKKEPGRVASSEGCISRMRLDCPDRGPLTDKSMHSAKPHSLEYTKAPCWESVTDKTSKLTCVTRGSHTKSGRRHEFPSEMGARVLTNVARGIPRVMCSCAKPKGPWEGNEFTECTPSIWFLGGNLETGGLRAGKSLALKSPCVPQAWGTLDSTT